MKKVTFTVVCLMILIVGSSVEAFAHCGYTSCGVIVNGVFYTEDNNSYNGSPAMETPTSGWINQGNSCKGDRGGWSIRVNGQDYNKTEHKFTCNLPLDDYIPLLLLLVAALGFFWIHKKLAYT